MIGSVQYGSIFNMLGSAVSAEGDNEILSRQCITPGSQAGT